MLFSIPPFSIPLFSIPKPASQGSDFAAFLGFLAEAARSRPVRSAACLLLLLWGALSAVGIAVASARLVDALVSGKGGPQALSLLPFVLAGLLLSSQAAEMLRSQLAREIGHAMTGAVDSAVMESCARMDRLVDLEAEDTANLITATRQVGSIEVAAGDAIGGLMSKASLALAGLAAAALLSTYVLWLGPFVLVGMGLCYWLCLRVYRRGVQASFDEAGIMRRAAYLRGLAIGGEAAKEIRLFGLAPYLQQAHAEAWRNGMERIWSARQGTGALRIVVPLIVTGVYIVALSVVCLPVARGEASVGRIAAAGLAVRILHGLLAWDYNDLAINWGARLVGAAARLRTRSPHPDRTPLFAPALRQELSCRQLEFRYGTNEPAVLKGVDFNIRAGSSIAIVGLNGAGKSTLVRLLSGLDEPTSGAVACDGQCLEGPARAAWRRKVALCLQDFTHYEVSLAENIGFGAPEHLADREGIIAVGRQLQLDKLAADLPQGWDTILSSHYPGGVELSGGQWQRIAIARALFAVHHGAELLVLDEPAASLDIRAEAELNTTILKLAGSCTTVLISHRLAAVREADRILVLNEGVIAEDGSHDELIKHGGLYAELFALQARRFSEAA